MKESFTQYRKNGLGQRGQGGMWTKHFADIPKGKSRECYLCDSPTRILRKKNGVSVISSEGLYCKKCRYDIHYSRRIDGNGNRYIELEDFILDPFYD